jgi:hypothetical protein
MIGAVVLLLLGGVIVASIGVLVRSRGRPRRPLTAAQLNLLGPSIVVLGSLTFIGVGAAGGILLYMALGGLGHDAYAEVDEATTRQDLLRELERLAPPLGEPGKITATGCDTGDEVQVRRRFAGIDAQAALRHFTVALPDLGWTSTAGAGPPSGTARRLAYVKGIESSSSLEILLPQGTSPLRVTLSSSLPCS